MDFLQMDESKRCSVVSSHGPEESDILVASLEVVEWKSEVKTLSLRAVFTDHTTFIFRDGTLDDLESFLVGEKLAIPAQGKVVLAAMTQDIDASTGLQFLGFMNLFRPSDRARASPVNLCISHNGCEIVAIEGRIHPGTLRGRVQRRLLSHAEEICKLLGTRHLWLMVEREGYNKRLFLHAGFQECQCAAEGNWNVRIRRDDILMCKEIPKEPDLSLLPQELNQNGTQSAVKGKSKGKIKPRVRTLSPTDPSHRRGDTEERLKGLKRIARPGPQLDSGQQVKRVQRVATEPNKVSIGVSHMLIEATRCMSVLQQFAARVPDCNVGEEVLQVQLEQVKRAERSWQDVSELITTAIRGAVFGIRTHLEISRLQVPDVG